MSDKATAVFGASHAEIAQLLTDNELGTTYATSIDVPGIKSISVTANSNTVELRGDNKKLAQETVVQSVELTIEFAKWDARIFALITGAVLVEDLDGSYTVLHTADSTPTEFSLMAVSAAADNGATVSIYAPKLKITNLPDMIGLAEEEFKTVSVVCEAIPTFTGDWISYSYTPAV